MKQEDSVSEDDGFVLVSRQFLFWKPPTKSANFGKALDLSQLNCLEDSESCTCLAGCYSSKTVSHIWIGTTNGRLVKLSLSNLDLNLVKFETVYDISDLKYEHEEEESLFSRLFTPRKAKLKQDEIVSITKNKKDTRGAALTKLGGIIIFASDSEETSITRLQKGYNGKAIFFDEITGSLCVFASSSHDAERWTLFESTSGGKSSDFFEVSSKTNNFSCLKAPKASKCETDFIFVSGLDAHNSDVFKVFDWELSENINLDNDQILAFNAVPGGLIFITKIEGVQLYEIQGASLFSSKKKPHFQQIANRDIPRERVEKSMNMLISDALDHAFSNSDVKIEEVMQLLSNRDDWKELKDGNSESKLHAYEVLLDFCKARLYQIDSKKHVNVNLQVKMTLIKLAIGFVRGLNLPDTYEDSNQVNIQTLGEELFATIECSRLPYFHTFIKEFSFQGDEDFFNDLQNIRKLIQKSSELEKGSTEDVLGIFDAVLKGIETWNQISNSNLSMLSKLLRPFYLIRLGKMVKLLEKDPSIVASQKTLKILSALTKRALEVQSAPDALDSLLSIIRGSRAKLEDLTKKLLESSQTKQISRDVASLKNIVQFYLEAVKELAENYLEFNSLIEACFIPGAEDIEKIVECMKKWQDKNFASQVYVKLLERKRYLAAFQLAEQVEHSRLDLINALENLNIHDLIWLAYLKNNDNLKCSISLLPVERKLSSNLGIITSYVSEYDQKEDRKGSDQCDEYFLLHLCNRIQLWIEEKGNRESDTLIDLLQTVLLLSKDSKGIDFVWIHSILADVHEWKKCKRNANDYLVYDFSKTVFVRLSRRIRDNHSKLLPKEDFFNDLSSSLENRINKSGSLSHHQENLMEEDIEILAKTLRQWILK